MMNLQSSSRLSDVAEEYTHPAIENQSVQLPLIWLQFSVQYLGELAMRKVFNIYDVLFLDK